MIQKDGLSYKGRMIYLQQLLSLYQAKIDAVLVSIVEVRGHAPRASGAKMIVTNDAVWGSIGGGNIEHWAMKEARDMLRSGVRGPQLHSQKLNPESGQYGVQCCGGEVRLLLEPHQNQRPCILLFGAGHVARELIRIAQHLPWEIHCVDSRSELLDTLDTPKTAELLLHKHHSIAPEAVLTEMAGIDFAYIMTHDHAEDLAVLERLLRQDKKPFIGLIGSSVKWSHFQRKLLALGLEEEDLASVHCPIGISGIAGKSPSEIAIAVVAEILQKITF